MEARFPKYETELLIIGGGATGAGIFRDATKRGIDTILIEKNDYATGTSGRNHGLLHSGARYAVKDPESAIECIQENKILKKIASSVVEKTGGFFVAMDERDLEYSEKFTLGLKKTGIDYEELSLEKAFSLEKELNSNIKRVIRVPDGSIDPFRLTIMNVQDGVTHGGKSFHYAEIIESGLKENNIEWVKVKDYKNNREFKIYPQYIVNATGPWAHRTADLLHASMPMKPSMGVMVILDHRMVNHVINRMRMPSDGDIIVPGDTVSIIGTTSRLVNDNELDHLKATPEEIYRMIQDAETLVPRFSSSRMLRHYSGARPLADTGEIGRNVSRNFQIKDHAKKSEPINLFSITGGKLMTYRLMAEKMTDIISDRLNISNKCRTHKDSLPPKKKKKLEISKYLKNNYGMIQGYYRQGDPFAKAVHHRKDVYLICECEMITNLELEYSMNETPIHKLSDLRRRTRLGMGPCQGTLCSIRTMELKGIQEKSHKEKKNLLKDFIQERWKGIKDVFWGDTLRNEEFAMWLYAEIIGIEDNEN